jgi:hypothetical protein
MPCEFHRKKRRKRSYRGNAKERKPETDETNIFHRRRREGMQREDTSDSVAIGLCDTSVVREVVPGFIAKPRRSENTGFKAR